MFQIAQALFARQAAERVIACVFPKSRAAMHLDTVFTLCDRDLVNVYREGVDEIRPLSLRPGDTPGGLDMRPTTSRSWTSSRRRSNSRSCAS